MQHNVDKVRSTQKQNLHDARTENTRNDKCNKETDWTYIETACWRQQQITDRSRKSEQHRMADFAFVLVLRLDLSMKWMSQCKDSEETTMNMSGMSGYGIWHISLSPKWHCIKTRRNANWAVFPLLPLIWCRRAALAPRTRKRLKYFSNP